MRTASGRHVRFEKIKYKSQLLFSRQLVLNFPLTRLTYVELEKKYSIALTKNVT